MWLRHQWEAVATIEKFSCFRNGSLLVQKSQELILSVNFSPPELQTLIHTFWQKNGKRNQEFENRTFSITCQTSKY